MSYYLAPSLAVLRDEINQRWPNRDRRSDGWIGDARHRATKSDHNPNSRGSVNAIDVDADGVDVEAIIAAVQRHPSAHYWIYRRQIADRDDGWRRRPYTGSNPHDGHIHISIRQTREAEQDRRPWGLLEDDMQLSDQVTLPSWARTTWPADKGLADGKISVQTALAGAYCHARLARERAGALAAQMEAVLHAVTGGSAEEILAAVRAEGERTRAALLAEVRQLAPTLAQAAAAELGRDESAEAIGRAIARELAALVGEAAEG